MWMRVRSLIIGALEGVRPIRRPSAKPSGKLFIEVFDARGEERSLPTGAARRSFLAQGTLYPDVIESVSFTGGPSVTIKSAP